MELRDFIVTPLLLIAIYFVAYISRSRVTDTITRRYFFPALTFKILGALALGFLYQFYYKGGDTFNFHTFGSRIIWEAFIDSPDKGLKLLFAYSDTYPPGTYTYASRIFFFNDPSSYFIIRIAAVFDFITFSAYSATAVLFSVFSFVGSWAFFSAFYRQTPKLHFSIALPILFIPSVIFWGSGLLKDTVTFGCLGLMTYAISNLFIIKHPKKFWSVVLLLISAFIIFSIKKYILLCFLPATFLWIYASRLKQIKQVVFKVMILPFVMGTLIGGAYYAVVLIGQGDSRYSIDKLGETARITAYDIGFYSGKDAGSGYSLGELDGSTASMLKLAPQAINVSLFRPYLWEVRNPLMLLSAFESVLVLIFTLYVLIKKRGILFQALIDPTVVFCLVFSLAFAFAVGVSTFNFGTLARYKIPLLPYYLLALIFILNYEKSDRKLDMLDNTE